jgi:hypothetical protein
MVDVNVSVMADRIPITVAIVHLHTLGLHEGTDTFCSLLLFMSNVLIRNRDPHLGREIRHP